MPLFPLFICWRGLQCCVFKIFFLYPAIFMTAFNFGMVFCHSGLLFSNDCFWVWWWWLFFRAWVQQVLQLAGLICFWPNTQHEWAGTCLQYCCAAWLCLNHVEFRTHNKVEVLCNVQLNCLAPGHSTGFIALRSHEDLEFGYGNKPMGSKA